MNSFVLQAYTAGYDTPKDNLHLLEDLVGTRYEMAQLMDAPSYAHYKLNSATLAGSPEAVESFLQELLAAIQPKVSIRPISIAGTQMIHAHKDTCSAMHACLSIQMCVTGGR